MNIKIKLIHLLCTVITLPLELINSIFNLVNILNSTIYDLLRLSIMKIEYKFDKWKDKYDNPI